VNAEFPAKLEFLFEPHRYKVAWGGRGGAKSWAFARALLIQGAQRPLRILCARETQKSIADSVHKLLEDQIRNLGLERFYNVGKASIKGITGTEIVFAGLKHNVNNIKSVEACDIVWVEEAQTVSRQSWEVLIPTIRKQGSEIWVSFNPDLETDDTYQRFVKHAPPNAAVVKINYSDNPWFPDVLREEMEHLRATDPAAFHHIWEGNCKSIAEGAIYAEELRAADTEQRITRVPYDETRPVLTFWDLGFGDATSIWLAQAVGREYHLIDFIEGQRKPIAHYLRELQARPYLYGTFYLPHDARAKELGSGKSIEELIRASGREVQIVTKLSINDGINAARTVFRQCWFDEDKCADGIQSLRHYRWGETAAGLATREPVHDWASHAADAFRYFAVAIQTPERQIAEARREYEELNYTEDAWMA
jgi:phage terminase large subunit